MTQREALPHDGSRSIYNTAPIDYSSVQPDAYSLDKVFASYQARNGTRKKIIIISSSKLESIPA